MEIFIIDYISEQCALCYYLQSVTNILQFMQSDITRVNNLQCLCEDLQIFNMLTYKIAIVNTENHTERIRQQGSIESDFLNSEIVRLARKLGRTAPFNQKFTEIFDEMALKHEKLGKYTVNQLCALLGLANPPTLS